MLDGFRSSVAAEAISDAVQDAFQDAARRATPEKLAETGAVMAATGMLTPFAAAQEMAMFGRRVRGMNMQYAAALARSRNVNDVMDANMRYGERMLGLAFGEFGRVLERSALMGRRAAAPGSLSLRDADVD